MELVKMTKTSYPETSKQLHDANNLIQRIYCTMLMNQGDDAGSLQEINQQICEYIKKNQQPGQSKGA